MIGTYFIGRLGNNMYQYAYIKTMSDKLKYDFMIIEDSMSGATFNQFNDIFPHLEFNKSYNKPDNIFNQLISEDIPSYEIDQKFVNILDGTLTRGHLQNHNWFNIDSVKEWFRIYLDDNQLIEYNEIMTSYNPNEYCYINFRGSDFLTNPTWNTNPEFYKEAQKFIPNKKFLVITDDIYNAKLHINADKYICPNYKIALKLLTKANNLIIPGWTTFAWWGAYLSNAEKIIQPDVFGKYINPGSNHKCYIKNDKFIYL